MNDFLRMKVLQPLQHLEHEVFNLVFAEAPLLFDQVVEGLGKEAVLYWRIARARCRRSGCLRSYAKTLLHFDSANSHGSWSRSSTKSHTVYLLLRPLLHQRRFLDNFYSQHLFTVFRYQLVAPRESSFTQKVAFHVSADGVGLEAVVFDDAEVFMG